MDLPNNVGDTRGWSLSLVWKDALETEMGTHQYFHVENARDRDPDRLQSMGLDTSE